MDKYKPNESEITNTAKIDEINLITKPEVISPVESKKNVKSAYVNIAIILFAIVLSLFGFIYYKISHLDMNKIVSEQLKSTNYITKINGKINVGIMPHLNLTINDIQVTNRKTKVTLTNIRKLNIQINLIPLIFNNVRVVKIKVDDSLFSYNELSNVNFKTLFNNQAKDPLLFSQLTNIEIKGLNISTESNLIVLSNGALYINLNKTNNNFKASFELESQNTTANLVADITSSQNHVITLDNIITKIHFPLGHIDLHSTGIIDLKTPSINFEKMQGTINYKDQTGTINLSNFMANNRVVLLDSLVASLGNKTEKANVSLSQMKINHLSIFDVNQMVLVYDFTTENKNTVTLKVSNINNKLNINNFVAECELDLTKRDNYNKVIKNDILIGGCYVDVEQKYLGVNINGTLGASHGHISLIYDYMGKSANSNIILDNLTLPNSISEINYSVDMLSLLLYTNKMNVAVKLDKLVVSDESFDDLSFNLMKTESLIEVANIKSQLFGGKFNGELQLKNQNVPADFMMSGRISDIDLGRALSTDSVVGSANINFNIHAKDVTNLSDIKNKLSGRVDFTSQNGKFMKYGISGLNPEKSNLQKYETMFGDFVFNNGVSSNNSISLSSSTDTLKGAGTVDLVQNTVDYNLDIFDRLNINQANLGKTIIASLQIVGPLNSPKVLLNKLKIESSIANPVMPVQKPKAITKAKHIHKQHKKHAK